jgi:hypothetical protein
MTIKDKIVISGSVINLIAGLTLTLAEFPAGRPGWASPIFLALSLWFVSVFCRWPIPDGVCDGDCPTCERSER